MISSASSPSSPKRKSSSAASVYSLSSFDSSSDTSSVASTLTSTTSGGGSWSVPRSRSFRPNGGSGSGVGKMRPTITTNSSTRRNSHRDGPRRLGGSFRVSLRPNRHRKASSNNGDLMDGEYYYYCCEWIFTRKVLTLILLIAMIGGICLTIEQQQGQDDGQSNNMLYLTNHVYNMYEKLSTEDLVAQGEMSARMQSDDGIVVVPQILTREDNENVQQQQIEEEEEATKKRMSFYQKILSNTVEATVGGLRSSRGRQKMNKDTTKPTRWQDQNRTDWGPNLDETRREPHTVGYVLPIFSCYKLNTQATNQYGVHEPSTDKEFHDAAIMLQASIHENSKRNPTSGSSYDYEMVALVHVGVESCGGGNKNRSQILESIGYRVETVREPIHKQDIRDPFLQRHAPRNNGGRAGMREMIRLFAYKMEEYSIVVLVDTTVMLLHPPDAIYDVMLNGPRDHSWLAQHEDHIVKDTFYANGTIATMSSWPEQVDIMYARDYTTMNPSSWVTGISLDFLPLRPNRKTFQDLINVYQKTPYDPKWGWDHKGYAEYAGSMMTKGLLTYYYNEIAPDRKLELHRCIYNNMGDIPFIAGTKTDNCRDVKEHNNNNNNNNGDGGKQQPIPCTDCRIRPWDEIVVANFAICNVPWTCPYTDDTSNVPLLAPTIKICRQYLENWFRLRQQLEEEHLTEEQQTRRSGSFHEEVFHGYCLPGGQDGNGSYEAMGESLLMGRRMLLWLSIESSK